MRERLVRSIAMAGVASGAILLASPAFAQQAQADDAVPEGEIVVTATKRAESLQSVPISVSAIGGDALSKSRVMNVDSLVTKVANLQLTSIVGDNTPIFSLRGVSMSDYSLNQASPVATYYDEVYKGNFAFLGVAMYDLERVEVLRGPQGTLYGKNTIGGAVNVVSKKPDLDIVRGEAAFTYGRFDEVTAKGYVSAPLVTDKLALSLAGVYDDRDGIVTDPATGKKYNDRNNLSGRAILRAKPSETVEISLAGDYTRQRNALTLGQATAPLIGMMTMARAASSV
ncbi:MAG: TonB-dependent receptor plug domain-containing protein, partial [Novosphingobium sp.]